VSAAEPRAFRGKACGRHHRQKEASRDQRWFPLKSEERPAIFLTVEILPKREKRLLMGIPAPLREFSERKGDESESYCVAKEKRGH